MEHPKILKMEEIWQFQMKEVTFQVVENQNSNKETWNSEMPKDNQSRNVQQQKSPSLILLA